MENKLLQKLANQLNLTSPEQVEEPYILTPDEEKEAISNAIKAKISLLAWRMQEIGALPQQIEMKIKAVDWRKEINEEEVLQIANSNKVHEQWQVQNRKKEIDDQVRKIEELKRKWTYKKMFQWMKFVSAETFKRKLIVDPFTTPLIKSLCFFLSGDARFETELNFDPKKGLLIRGISGLGKTYLVKCIQDNELNPVQIENLIEITDEVKASGAFELSYKSKILYLDDVGTEETPVNFYGTKITWFKDFVELYYSKDLPFNRLMISTNCNFDTIEQKYGFRVRSRMKDMFNIVDVTGKDLRG